MKMTLNFGMLKKLMHGLEYNKWEKFEKLFINIALFAIITLVKYNLQKIVTIPIKKSIIIISLKERANLKI